MDLNFRNKLKIFFIVCFIFCLGIQFLPIIVIFDDKVIGGQLNVILFFIKFISLIIIPILYGIFVKLDLEIGGKIVLSLISAVPIFFLFVICVFGSFCEYDKPKILYKHDQFSFLMITSTQMNCGALDSGDSPEKYYKTLKLFESINILYEGIDSSEIDTLTYKMNNHYDPV